MDDAMQDNSTEIAAIFARGVCRFRQRKHRIQGEPIEEISSTIQLKQLDIPTENRPCVHSEKTVQRRISDE
jgi:hypothetical protein